MKEIIPQSFIHKKYSPDFWKKLDKTDLLSLERVYLLLESDKESIIDIIKRILYYYINFHFFRDEFLLVTPNLNKDHINLQFWGWAIVINKDGTWYWEDTSGG